MKRRLSRPPPCRKMQSSKPRKPVPLGPALQKVSKGPVQLLNVVPEPINGQPVREDNEVHAGPLFFDLLFDSEKIVPVVYMLGLVRPVVRIAALLHGFFFGVKVRIHVFFEKGDGFADLVPVWSKNSCGLTVVILEQPAEPFSTLNGTVAPLS